MFCKIELLPKQVIGKEEAESIIWSFLRSLECNGQILKDYKLIKNANYILYVTFPKTDSFNEKYDGIYVRRDRKRISELYDCMITPLGENTDKLALLCVSTPYCNRNADI